MRPLLLGEAPSARGDRYHAFPLSGPPAERICRVMGWDTGGAAAYWTLLDYFQTLNVVERWRDAERWSAVDARLRWREWRAENPGDLVVVALGRRAAAAIEVRGTEWGEWDGGPDDYGYLERVALPHPSGRNRLWNPESAEDVPTLYHAVLMAALEKTKESHAA